MKIPSRAVLSESYYLPRQGTIEDAEAMGAIAYKSVDLSLPVATQECVRILREPLVMSSTVVRKHPDGKELLVGVLNGILLRRSFSERLVKGKMPYFHIQVKESIKSPFPDIEEVGTANAGEGLDLFLAHFAVDPSLDDADSIRVRGMLTSYFVEQFAGNRVRRILVETVGWENTAMAKAGGFETVNRFIEWRAENGMLEREGPHVLQITLERALEVQNFQLAKLLQYQAPVFRFPAGSRELLRAAQANITDAKLAQTRGITDKAISSGWNRTYRIVRDVMPDLLPDKQTAKSGDRQAILEYVRHHPEELWPFTT